ncbi:MAG: hypothetical protein NC489_33110 [Ruminococcus flavefaciens]|nr:hypothetical protein [Ruminococcus flavefaciens]
MSTNMEEALAQEEQCKNENSFYDVFEKYDENDMFEYKLLVGIPILDIDE